jgi:dethiobiotin synthetase
MSFGPGAQAWPAARRSSGLFVTGTDTGVGKTVVACGLIRALRGRGIDCVGMKPVETGVGPEGPRDAIALRAASGGGEPLELVCPQRFALPAAPAVAATAAARRVDLGAIHAGFEALAARHDCVIVEGAGGLLVPVSEDVAMADLARDLGLSILIVARGRLGTINHALLTLEVARARGLSVAGVVVSCADGALSGPDRENLEWLRRSLGSLWLGEVPFVASETSGGAGIPLGTIDLDAIVRIARAPAQERSGAT